MRKLTIIQIGIIGIAIFFHHPSFSIPPTPPVTQNIGMLDFQFGNLNEPDCRICHSSGLPDRHHLLVDSSIPKGSLVPYPDANGDGFRDTIYTCENCHLFNKEGPIVVEDCKVCHNSSSPHHKTEHAQARNCNYCHGDIVDDFDDGHTIPTYKPSLVTPWSTNKLLGGEPLNSYGNSAGNCDYCHDRDGLDVPRITTNADLHHQTFGTDETKCVWCHDSESSLDKGIRRCQDCHGYESLHNIQLDSPNPSNIGAVVIGGEDAGYGHVGRDAGPNDSDCWGCHGSSGAFSPNPNEHPNYHHAFYGQTIPSTTEAPFGNAGEMYVCFSCHDTNFTVIRHCSVCHTTTIPPWTYFIFDMDGDGKEGLAEAIHALQVVAGVFVPENTNVRCSDGISNDGDPYIDCDDFDCNVTDVCEDAESTNALCSDGIDNDQNGWSDCDDFNCDITDVCEDAESTNALCSDGIDNDQNGWSDCDDFNCDITDVCEDAESTNALCSDGIDNDQNGWFDCDDFNCDITDVCEGTEVTDQLCSDGIDNDSNGWTDCYDLSCVENSNIMVCGNAETSNDRCSDSIDNDGDTFIDCDDFDCSVNTNVTICQ